MSLIAVTSVSNSEVTSLSQGSVAAETVTLYSDSHISACTAAEISSFGPLASCSSPHMATFAISPAFGTFNGCRLYHDAIATEIDVIEHIDAPRVCIEELASVVHGAWIGREHLLASVLGATRPLWLRRINRRKRNHVIAVGETIGRDIDLCGGCCCGCHQTGCEFHHNRDVCSPLGSSASFPQRFPAMPGHLSQASNREVVAFVHNGYRCGAPGLHSMPSLRPIRKPQDPAGAADAARRQDATSDN